MKVKRTTALYLASIVIANLMVAWYGPRVVVLNALVLIAFDITSRDYLHEAWHGNVKKLALLIAAGSILSAVLDYAALPVALASFCAFALSEAADTLVYARLEARGWYWKVNGSNLVSAAVDSVVFLSLLAAFGGLPWALVPLLASGQFVAKVLGGAIWAYVLRPRARARDYQVTVRTP